MTSKNLTYNHQTARQRLSTSRTICRSLASPYPSIRPSTPRPATPTQSQDPSVSDLFTTLLFDRQRAYQSGSCAPPAPLLAPVTRTEKIKSAEQNTGTWFHQTPLSPSKLHVIEEEDIRPLQGHVPLPGNLKPAMISKAPIVSRKRGRPAKQTPTKDAGKTITDIPKKRAVPARLTSRTTAKRQKTEANSKQKLDHKGSMGNSMKTASTTKSDKDVEIITISDSEDDEFHPMRKDKIGSSNDEDTRFGAPKINIHEDDDDVKPSIPTLTENPEPTQHATKRNPFVPFDQTPRWAFSGLDISGSESDLHHGPSRSKLQNNMAYVEAEHKQEKEQLRKELDSAKAELDKIKRLHEKDKGDSELMQVRSSNMTRQATQRLQQELETERSSLRAVMRERDQQRIDVDKIKARNDQLARELQEERRLREADRREHQSIMEDVMKAKEPTSYAAANDFLVTENGRLRTENETLRVAAAAAAATRLPSTPQSAFPPALPSILTPPSSQLSQSSPYHSIFASQEISPAPSSPAPYAPAVTTEGRKEENIRKVYLRVKMQFDTLQLATGNLINCTRGMDLSSFGQFGKYLRQLRTALEEDPKTGVENKTRYAK